MIAALLLLLSAVTGGNAQHPPEAVAQVSAALQDVALAPALATNGVNMRGLSIGGPWLVPCYL